MGVGVSEPQFERVRLRAIVRGLVQGVGFRAFVRHHGSALGLYGYARNLPDGSVEIDSEGRRIALEELLRQVQTGPRFARVDSCEVEWLDPTGATGWFEAR
ncbi:MAG: acylphosphatase [Chloroflexi bacterium]|nr:acylphosphatase [Chloroflexota bacterium]